MTCFSFLRFIPWCLLGFSSDLKKLSNKWGVQAYGCVGTPNKVPTVVVFPKLLAFFFKQISVAFSSHDPHKWFCFTEMMKKKKTGISSGRNLGKLETSPAPQNTSKSTLILLPLLQLGAGISFFFALPPTHVLRIAPCASEPGLCFANTTRTKLLDGGCSTAASSKFYGLLERLEILLT